MEVRNTPNLETFPAAIPPPDMATTPWGTYQVDTGYRQIATQPGTLLAWDMGVGKSWPVVAAITNLPDVNLVLIACPKSVCEVWPEQFEEHASRPVNVVVLNSGTVLKRRNQAIRVLQIDRARRNSDTQISKTATAILNYVFPETDYPPVKVQPTFPPLVFVINYEAARAKEFREWAIRQSWDMVVCDEIHRIKSPQGLSAKTMWRLGQMAKRRVGLTGTPMPHSPSDIFAQFRFLDEKIFGRFVTRFRCEHIKYGGFMVNGRATEEVGLLQPKEFYAKVALITSFVKKGDVLDLPKAVHERRIVVLDKKAEKAYRELDAALVTQVEGGDVTVANTMVKLIKLQQVTSGFLRLDPEETGGKKVDVPLGDEKQKVLAGVLCDLPSDEPVVVFCRFHHDLDVIRSLAKQCNRVIYELSGRCNELAQWQAKEEHHSGANKPIGQGDILAVQIQAGGVGIDLTRAAYCIYYSQTFNLGDYQQSLARLDRPGQTRSVTYIHLVANQKIDKLIYTALQRRENVIEAVVAEIKTVIAEHGTKVDVRPIPEDHPLLGIERQF